MTRSLFTPDPHATKAALRTGAFPPMGVYTRTFVENFLSPGTPRSTFMLQVSSSSHNSICMPPVALFLHMPHTSDKPWRVASSFSLPLSLPTVNLLLRLQSEDYSGNLRFGIFLQSAARIGCFASNIGVAAGTVIGLSERHGVGNTSAVPTMLVQWALGAELSTAITYFSPPLRSTMRQKGNLSPASDSHLALIRAPYVLYGVKYIDLVSLAEGQPLPGQSFSNDQNLISLPLFPNGLQAKSGFEMCLGPGTLGAGAKTRLKSRINKFTPHCICRPPIPRCQ